MHKPSSVLYAIAKGRTTGIVSTWEECKLHTQGFPGAKFKSFRGPECKATALEWLQGGEDRVLSLPSDEGGTFVYTDGSCVNNGTPRASGGIGIYYEDGMKISRPLSKSHRQTNNVAELEAILVVLRNAVAACSPPDITIVTDSEYSIREISNSRERSGEYPNKSLICEARALLAQLPGVKLMHVRAHTGKQDRHSVGNSIADQLALEAARYAGN